MNTIWKSLILLLIQGVMSPLTLAEVDDQKEYTFDPMLFRDRNISVDLVGKLNKSNVILPDIYKLDIYINSKFVSNENIKFIDRDGDVLPCFTKDFISKFNILPSNKENNYIDSCKFLDQIVDGAYSSNNFSKLRMDLSIPQANIKNFSKDYVPIGNLETGELMFFINYLANYNHVNSNGDKSNNQDYIYALLNGGINVGAWQYRQQSVVNYTKNGRVKWNLIRNFIQRPLPSLQGIMFAGQLTTKGIAFSGINFNGVSLDSDDRTLPSSQRGYAPTITGIADTTAVVSIKQDGYEIYETTVSPGKFIIDGLYATNYNGDLEVEIKQVNGIVKRFIVPFSAVPESLRPTQSRYSLSAGKTSDTGEKSYFVDMEYRIGLTNSITLNSGARIANNYVAIAFGGIVSNFLGAFGLQNVYTNTKVNPLLERLTGARTSFSYSKTIQSTNTTIALAAYHYSTAGYRELSDTLFLRGDINPLSIYKNSDTYLQKSRFDLTFNQQLTDKLGNFFVTLSKQNYRNHIRPANTQLQLGYSNVFAKNINFNLMVNKQQVASNNTFANYSNEIATSISLSMPLGSENLYNSSVMMNYMRSKDNSGQTQVGLSGVIGFQKDINYSLSINEIENKRNRSMAANLQKSFSNFNFGLTAAIGQNYWQAGANIQGAAVIHRNGVTFGSYLGDTFALIEAKGAEGAHIFNTKNTKIDSNGYALIPSLTPYQYNKIIISPQGTFNTVELLESEKQVAPYAGSSVKVNFKTKFGYPLLIKLNMLPNSVIPLGTEVFDEKEHTIGMVGQNNQLYIRTNNLRGSIRLVWGSDNTQQCLLQYDATNIYKKSNLVTKLTANCDTRSEISDEK